MPISCQNCGKTGRVAPCRGCAGKAHYCSVSCATIDWPAHKQHCIGKVDIFPTNPTKDDTLPQRTDKTDTLPTKGDTLPSQSFGGGFFQRFHEAMKEQTNANMASALTTLDALDIPAANKIRIRTLVQIAKDDLLPRVARDMHTNHMSSHPDYLAHFMEIAKLLQLPNLDTNLQTPAFAIPMADAMMESFLKFKAERRMPNSPMAPLVNADEPNAEMRNYARRLMSEMVPNIEEHHTVLAIDPKTGRLRLMLGTEYNGIQQRRRERFINRADTLYAEREAAGVSDVGVNVLDMIDREDSTDDESSGEDDAERSDDRPTRQQANTQFSGIQAPILTNEHLNAELAVIQNKIKTLESINRTSSQEAELQDLKLREKDITIRLETSPGCWYGFKKAFRSCFQKDEAMVYDWEKGSPTLIRLVASFAFMAFWIFIANASNGMAWGADAMSIKESDEYAKKYFEHFVDEYSKSDEFELSFEAEQDRLLSSCVAKIDELTWREDKFQSYEALRIWRELMAEEAIDAFGTVMGSTAAPIDRMYEKMKDRAQDMKNIVISLGTHELADMEQIFGSGTLKNPVLKERAIDNFNEKFKSALLIADVAPSYSHTKLLAETAAHGVALVKTAEKQGIIATVSETLSKGMDKQFGIYMRKAPFGLAEFYDFYEILKPYGRQLQAASDAEKATMATERLRVIRDCVSWVDAIEKKQKDMTAAKEFRRRAVEAVYNAHSEIYSTSTRKFLSFLEFFPEAKDLLQKGDPKNMRERMFPYVLQWMQTPIYFDMLNLQSGQRTDRTPIAALKEIEKDLDTQGNRGFSNLNEKAADEMIRRYIDLAKQIGSDERYRNCADWHYFNIFNGMVKIANTKRIASFVPSSADFFGVANLVAAGMGTAGYPLLKNSKVSREVKMRIAQYSSDASTAVLMADAVYLVGSLVHWFSYEPYRANTLVNTLTHDASPIDTAKVTTMIAEASLVEKSVLAVGTAVTVAATAVTAYICGPPIGRAVNSFIGTVAPGAKYVSAVMQFAVGMRVLFGEEQMFLQTPKDFLTNEFWATHAQMNTTRERRRECLLDFANVFENLGLSSFAEPMMYFYYLQLSRDALIAADKTSSHFFKESLELTRDKLLEIFPDPEDRNRIYQVCKNVSNMTGTQRIVELKALIKEYRKNPTQAPTTPLPALPSE